MGMASLMFGLMFLFMATGIPIGLVSVINYFYYGFSRQYFRFSDDCPANVYNNRFISPFSNTIFILAGNLMEYGGISRRLIAFIRVFLKRVPAALPSVTTVASGFFGAISGSNPATVAAIGGVMAPHMIEAGYKKADAAAIIASSGTLGVIIPPSIPMVVYAITASVSVASMFMAGFIPGFLLIVGMCIVHFIKFRETEKISHEKTTLREALHTTLDASFALIMPLIILGDIRRNFTPTEAAAVSCVYAFIIGIFVYKELKISDLPGIFNKTAKTTAIALLYFV